MHDHRKLRAFELADQLAILVWGETMEFPVNARFELASQMRKAAVSVASNIVEGCARSSKKDYVRFLDIALGSAHELEYQISLAIRLELFSGTAGNKLAQLSSETCRVLNGLVRSNRRKTP